jgi:PBSX family phage terminase large subunit
MATPAKSEAPPIKMRRFGPRAAEFAYRAPAQDARINLVVGAVRSAKTWASFPKILQLCQYDVGGLRLLTGVTKQTVYDNILRDLFELADLAGSGNYSYNRQTGDLRLFDAEWVVIGAKDEGSEKFLRGKTVGIAVCDEVTLMPRSFFMMLLSRMSPDGARLYGTTNTDSPEHFVKREVIDNLAVEGSDKGYRYGLGRDLWFETWTMDDNPSLGEDYKRFIRRSYVGMFYARYILGQWVMAEGAIYRDCITDSTWYGNEDRPKGLLNAGHAERWITVDYGTANALAAIDVYDDGTTVWCEREYYWDSRVRGRQKTDREYADDLITWLGGNPQNPDPSRWPGVILDPSAASFKAELLGRGFFVQNAKNNVADGIRRVSTMLSRNRLRFNRANCPECFKYMQSYVWDDRRVAAGEDKPKKVGDHLPDAARYYTETRIGDWRLSF